MKLKNKFYVSHPRMVADCAGKSGQWSRPTLDAAVKHAQQLLRDDPDLEAAFVVKVVKVVRKQSVPLVVESVE